VVIPSLSFLSLSVPMTVRMRMTMLL
jgi:hypothetical protein